MNKLLRAGLLMLLLIPVLSCKKNVTITKEEAHWEYEHPDWRSIGYNDCGGNSQSPINIVTANTLKSNVLSAITFNYAPFSLKLVDNGHTIQVNAVNTTNTITYNGIQYQFLQLHFHHESEHQYNGVHAQIELHLVHRDATGNLLVLGYMINPGVSNALLEQALANVPAKQKVEETFTGVQVNLNLLQPADLGYYTYFGSLTTPPCSASVQFVLFKTAISATAQQIADFAKHYDNNARPVQPVNNRIILEKI